MSTAPAELERQLTRAILRGEHPPGSRLPTVRTMAATHGVSPATIQRVVERLQTRGLVTARQGSGLTVNDPGRVGDLSLLPAWLDALRDDGDVPVRMLADFLELRRTLAARLLVRHRDALLARLPELLPLAADMAAADPDDADALRRADLAFARAVVRSTPNVVALAVFNTLASLLEELPDVAAAMYAEPADNVATMHAVLAALADDADATTIEAAMAPTDARTVARFAESLGATVPPEPT